MLQLYLHERVPGESGDIIATDMTGTLRYVISGKNARWTSVVDVRDRDGTVLIKARQKRLSPFPTYTLERDGRKIGTFKKHAALLPWRAPYYRLRPQNWQVVGDFLNESYLIQDERKQTLANIEKCSVASPCQWTVVLRHVEESDVPLGVLIAVLIEHFRRQDETDSACRRKQDDAMTLGLMNYRLKRQKPDSSYKK